MELKFCHIYSPNICNRHLPVHLMKKLFPVIAFISQQKEAQKKKSKNSMKTKEKHRQDIISKIPNNSSSVDDKENKIQRRYY